jgi:murein DD-endopeptidase MepM/ murein hydrolase activator NlpD
MRTSAYIALPFLLLGAAAPAAAAGGDPTVAALQAALSQRGLYEGSVDGVQGPQTREAVLALQRARGLTVDGVAGPQTRAALGPLGRHKLGSRILHGGLKGLDVSGLQFLLSSHGFPCQAIDGDFGPHTDAAVRRFQRWARIFPDGLVGPDTLLALARPLPVVNMSLARPVRGLVGDLFGPRGDTFHPGVDIEASFGAPVHAAAPGRVAFAGSADGYGELVVIAHGDGLATWYAHLSRIDVHRGQVLAVGEQLGLIGSTGFSTGPHLHLELRLRGAAVDPLPHLG